MIPFSRDRSAAYVTDGDAWLIRSVISQSVAIQQFTESVTDVTGFYIKDLTRTRIGRVMSFPVTICHLSHTHIWMNKEYRP